jgi:DegV family protein with EDD domain
MIKIVTDTAGDMPTAWFDHYHVTTIPFNIQFGLETYRDGLTITTAEFYRRIESSQTLPTTSQPAIGEFIELYQKLAADGSEILSIQLTSRLSGAWQAAMLAARELEGQVKVSVIDSLTGSPGQGLMVREAAQLIEAGWSLEKIVPRLEARRAHIHVFIMLKDLRYARMSGRVGRIRETLAALLDIKPIIGTADGHLVPRDRVRSQTKGFQRMLTLAQQELGDAPVHVGVVHALAPVEAEALLAQLKNRLNCQDTFVTTLALSLAVHFGPGTVGFATYPAE